MNDLSGWVAGVEADNDTLRNEIRRLRRERDEARMEVCRMKSVERESVITPQSYAEIRKWDCFEEDSNA